MIKSIEKGEVSERVLGCNKECQFAPVPTVLFKEKKKYFLNFEKNFKSYNNEVVTPIFKRLKGCNHLLVVVDVPTILATSVFRHAETVVLLQFLYPACRLHVGKLRAAWNFLASHEWRWKKIDHVLAIGTKTDLVRVGDTDKYYSLLDDLVSREMNTLNSKRHGIKTEVFTCSAVESSSPSDKEKHRCVFLMKNPDGPGYKNPPGDGEVVMDDYFVDPLDEEWPDHWKEGDYIFPVVYPLVPKNVKKPPLEEGLKNIFNWICEVKS